MTVVMTLYRWPGVTVYYLRDTIYFPKGYLYRPLEHGISFACITYLQGNIDNQLCWFVSPNTFNPLYYQFSMPSVVMGESFQPNKLFRYDALTNRFQLVCAQQGQEVLLSGTSSIANDYRSRQAMYLQLLANTYAKLTQYSANELLLREARAIHCP